MIELHVTPNDKHMFPMLIDSRRITWAAPYADRDRAGAYTGATLGTIIQIEGDDEPTRVIESYPEVKELLLGAP